MEAKGLELKEYSAIQEYITENKNGYESYVIERKLKCILTECKRTVDTLTNRWLGYPYSPLGHFTMDLETLLKMSLKGEMLFFWVICTLPTQISSLSRGMRGAPLQNERMPVSHAPTGHPLVLPNDSDTL